MIKSHIVEHCPIHRRWRRRSEARPGEIIDAALEVFAEKGFTAARLDDVAKLAGVSKGTVYRYFENKEALFKDVIRELMLPRIIEAESQVKQFGGTTSELLKGMSQFWRKQVMDKKISAIPKLVVAECGNFPEIARFYHENVVARGSALTEMILERGIKRGEVTPCDVRHTAQVLLAPFVYAAISAHSLRLADPRPFNNETYFEAYLNIALNGLLIKDKDD